MFSIDTLTTKILIAVHCLVYTATAQAVFIKASDGREVIFNNNSSEFVLDVVQGTLRGAYNVPTGAEGTYYDVKLVDDSFSDSIARDSALLPLSTTVWLSRAFLSEILRDFDWLELDSKPYLTYGCSKLSVCNIWNPYFLELGASLTRANVVANYSLNKYDRFFDRYLHKNDDLATDDEAVLAVWSLSETRKLYHVNEPAGGFNLLFVFLFMFTKISPFYNLAKLP